jgi:hypothetical protein
MVLVDVQFVRDGSEFAGVSYSWHGCAVAAGWDKKFFTLSALWC